MKKVISITAVCPLWKEPTSKSEMISQLLFCEQATVLKEEKDFSYIKCQYDDYEGWCLTNQISEVSDTTEFSLQGYSIEHHATALLNNTIIHLPLASPVYTNINTASFQIAFQNDRSFTKTLQANTSIAKELALQFLNVPYLWGGKSSFGIDCSGFAQQVFKMMGIYLPRDAYQQAAYGEPVDFLQQAQCGDLAFFDNENGEIIHVGILLNSNSIIHAAGYVRIDSIDNSGIIHSITAKRTHRLRIIKRMM